MNSRSLRCLLLALACVVLVACQSLGNIEDRTGDGTTKVRRSSSSGSSGSSGSSDGLLQNFSLWPFGGGGTELSRTPANAIEYRCDSGKLLYVRTLEDGAAWLIAPDREIRLPKLKDGEGGRFGVGRIVLEIRGESADLTDPPAVFAGCKRAGDKS